MALELGSLVKAVAALEQALGVTVESDVFPSLSAAMRDTLRAGVIQSFEVAYEQCWKMMRRWLEMNVGADAVDGVTRRELFRQAAEARLIDDVDTWMTYHFTRNLTSHTYDEDAAREAYERAATFLPFAREALARLESRRD